MFDDAKVFSERFRQTKFDLIVTKGTEEVFRVTEGLIVVALFAYLRSKFPEQWMAQVGYWLTYLTLAAYVGARTSVFFAGVIRGRGPVTPKNSRLIYLSGALGSLTVMYVVQGLVQAVVKGSMSG